MGSVVTENPLDQAVHDWIVRHRTGWATTLAETLTEIGSTTITVLGVLVVGVVLARRLRSWVPIAACAAAELAAEITARSTKALVGRDRPPYDEAIEHLANGAFPSGHVARAALLATLVVLVTPRARRRWAVLVGIVVVTVVAWTRVYLGAHWLTDTLAAWPAGVAAALAARWAWRRWAPAAADQPAAAEAS